MTILLVFVVWVIGWTFYFKKELFGDICLMCKVQEMARSYWTQLGVAYRNLEDSYESWAEKHYDQLVLKPYQELESSWLQLAEFYQSWGVSRYGSIKR